MIYLVFFILRYGPNAIHQVSWGSLISKTFLDELNVLFSLGMSSNCARSVKYIFLDVVPILKKKTQSC